MGNNFWRSQSVVASVGIHIFIPNALVMHSPYPTSCVNYFYWTNALVASVAVAARVFCQYRAITFL
ncbi:hypothetical protein [Nostoc sp. T09]|uniref:hypothetical protein n=1 Tax=Nostoc sp. T09 TaxID=1932621 RepID=UPI00117F2375|nr:hypothetical protein [Nostoc sp. T09]